MATSIVFRIRSGVSVDKCRHGPTHVSLIIAILPQANLPPELSGPFPLALLLPFLGILASRLLPPLPVCAPLLSVLTAQQELRVSGAALTLQPQIELVFCPVPRQARDERHGQHKLEIPGTVDLLPKLSDPPLTLAFRVGQEYANLRLFPPTAPFPPSPPGRLIRGRRGIRHCSASARES